MTSPATSKATSEQAFCAAIRCLAESPPEASTVEGGHKQGLNRGLLLLDPLHSLLLKQTGGCLSIDRFANHLVQFTRNQAKVSFEGYWEGQEGQSLHEAALVVLHPSKKPMCLAKLLDILRTCGTSIWLAQSAGAEGQRLMHALQQPSLAPAAETSQQQLDLLTQQPHALSERQAVISHRLRAQGSARTSSPHPVAGSCNATAELQPTEERCCADTSSLSPLAASTGAAQLRQTQEMQPDVALREHLHKEGCTDEIQAEQRQAQQGGAGQGWDNQGRADQGQAEEGQAQKDADEGEVQRARGGRRVTRASAQHVAFVQDMHASEDTSTPPSAKAAASDLDPSSGLDSPSEQDSFCTASEGLSDEEGLEHSEGNDSEAEEDTAARSWESTCQQAFPWDGKSSLMVCVDGEQKIWYQAHVVQLRNNHYLLSWPAFPERPEEWVHRGSRRIWRQDQIKHEYWNQQAPAFKQSKHRAWVLKSCYWRWQMSSCSDVLPQPHKDPAGGGAPRALRVEALRQDSLDSPQSQTPLTVELGRGFCFGCWTTKAGLQSVCGRCRIGACPKCRALWDDKRKYGAMTDEAGLKVHQANICFCGGHLTPRGAAAYDRKGKRRQPTTMRARSK